MAARRVVVHVALQLPLRGRGVAAERELPENRRGRERRRTGKETTPGEPWFRHS
jgi:hypothetical protein